MDRYKYYCHCFRYGNKDHADAINDIKHCQNLSRFVGCSIKIQAQAAIAQADTHAVAEKRRENNIDT